MQLQDKIQNDVVKAWQKNDKKGTVILATGSGKSKIFINILKKEKGQWLLVVPTEKLRDRNWKEEFIKWNCLDLYNNNLHICCYASLSKIDLNKYNGVALDECHNTTINNVQVFKEHYKRLHILCLTATEPKDEIKRHVLYNMLECKVIYNLTLKEAIKIGIVAPLQIFIHELQLSDIKNIKQTYKDKSTGKQREFYKSEKDNYSYIDRKINNKKFPTQFDYLFRAKFIYDSVTKTEYAKNLLNKIPDDKRVLVFSQSIKQIEKIMKETYHSKTNDHYYNLFIDEKLNKLGVVESLNEGENIKNLDIGLIVQCNSNPKNLFQRIGRIIRKRDNHIAQIHILMLMNTVDEKWINKMLEEYEDIITRIKI